MLTIVFSLFDPFPDPEEAVLGAGFAGHSAHRADGPRKMLKRNSWPACRRSETLWYGTPDPDVVGSKPSGMDCFYYFHISV